jgi:hypothetical protein
MKMKPKLTPSIMHFGQVHKDCHSVHSSMKLAQEANKEYESECENLHTLQQLSLSQ